jgi:putative DNA primase/helicase
MDGVPTLHIGNFKDGTSFNHSFNGGRSLTSVELAEQKHIAQRARKARSRERAKKQEATRKKARILWGQFQPARANNPYLVKKHMRPDGLKETTDGAIVAPILNNKVLVGLQFISLGSKRFLSGSRLLGSYFLYKPDDTYNDIMLCEGISTACTIWQLSGKKAVFASFSANNLEAVAVKIRAEFPHSKITVCADQDIREDAGALNTGVHYATIASRKVGAYLAIPEMNGKPCDFCDIWCNAIDALDGEDSV